MLLEAVSLSHRYADGSLGLDGCSLAIRRGSRNALLGANGNGKSTLAKLVAGRLPPQPSAASGDGSTATLTLTALPATPPPSAASSATVLVPEGMLMRTVL